MSASIVVSQLGARMHYAVPRIMEEAGILERLYTDICAGKGWPRTLGHLPQRSLPAALRRLAGRIPHGIPADKIVCFPGIGLAAVWQRTVDKSMAADTRAALLAGRKFSAAVSAAGFARASGFYGISGECLEQLEAARRRGLWTAVEQIIAPRQIMDRLVREAHGRHPGWEPDMGDDPLAREFAEREKAEWNQADLIVCPSQFVRDGIAQIGGPAVRCAVVPYGVDASFRLPDRDHADASRPLRVVTVGAAGLRKGTPDILQAAWRMRGRAEFRLVGPVAHLPEERRRELGQILTLTGQVPRSEILSHYRWADVFLLPSICEGSATVVYEALAAGLPVITTANAGSVVRDGVEGFICPVGDVDAICAAVDQLAGDRDRLRWLAGNARERAADYDLKSYGRRLLAALAPLRADARNTELAS